MDPITIGTLALQGLSAAGGIFGRKRKHIDPEELRRRFGPAAVSRETLELANYILNSPYGQQLMASAAEQGQTLQTEMAARAADSGLSPDTGGQSGASDFAVAAGAGAQSGFERQARTGIYQSAMPLAAEMVAERQRRYVEDLQGGGYQGDSARMWEAIGGAAGTAAAMIPARGGSSTPSAALREAGAAPTPAPSLRPTAPAQLRPDAMVPVPTPQVTPAAAMISAPRRSRMRAALSSGAVRPAYA